MKKIKKGAIKKTGKFHGKSNALGHGGRAAQMKAQGVPGGVIGNLARKAKAAPGQVNFHGNGNKGNKGKKKGKMSMSSQPMSYDEVKKNLKKSMS